MYEKGALFYYTPKILKNFPLAVEDEEFGAIVRWV